MVTAPKVLIIDDSSTQRMYMRQALQGAGYQVLVANDGLEGLRIIAHDSPQCLVLDIVLPGMNGFEVCRHLRAQEAWRNLPIIMVSSKNASSDRFWAMRQGATAYLIKPFKAEELVEEVRKVVAERPRQPNTSLRPEGGGATGPQRSLNPSTPPPASGWSTGSQSSVKPPQASPLHASSGQDVGGAARQDPQGPQFTSLRYGNNRSGTGNATYPQGSKVQSSGQQPRRISETGPQQPLKLQSMGALPLLVPRRIDGAEIPFINRQERLSIAEQRARLLYLSIDGQKNIEELVRSTQMSREDIMGALSILVHQQYILLYEPGGRLVDSSFL